MNSNFLVDRIESVYFSTEDGRKIKVDGIKEINTISEYVPHNNIVKSIIQPSEVSLDFTISFMNYRFFGITNNRIRLHGGKPVRYNTLKRLRKNG